MVSPVGNADVLTSSLGFSHVLEPLVILVGFWHTFC